jgi:predicted transcriptional regulator
MRRRLLALNYQQGGGIVRSLHKQGKPRKYFVLIEALKLVAERDPDAIETELGDLRSRLDEHERRLDAIRETNRRARKRAADEHQATQARLAQLELRFGEIREKSSVPQNSHSGA